MYDVSLWKHYSAAIIINKFVSCYNKCIKVFGYAGMDSILGVLIDLGLPSANTVLHNARTLFERQYRVSCNRIVQCFVARSI